MLFLRTAESVVVLYCYCTLFSCIQFIWRLAILYIQCIAYV